MSEQAVAFKNEGNAAFSAQDYETALAKFTAAAEADPTYHVAFSNRSAVHTRMGNYAKALDDANKVIEIKGDWPKGYLRKGTALAAMGNADEALAAYDAGLAATGQDASIQAAKDKLVAQQQGGGGESPFPGGNPFAKMFGPDVWTKIAMNPTTAGYMNDPSFVQMINTIQSDTTGQAVNQFMNDPRFQAVLMMLLGAQMPGGDGAAAGAGGDAAPAAAKAPEPEPTPEPEPELSEEEAAAKAVEDKAAAIKAEGNQLYKSKDLEGALAKYLEAKALVPTCTTYYLNEASVYIEQGEYAMALETVDEAMTVAKDAMAGFETYAKILVKKGNVYFRMQQYEEAQHTYEAAQREHRTSATLKLINKAKKAAKKAASEAYFDEEKAALAKAEGNDAFRAADYPKAVEAYTEAIKRNPNDHTFFSNRAAALTKLGALPDALEDIAACLRLEPTFVRAYERRAQVEMLMKQYYRAIDSYDAMLELDPDNQAALQGLAKVEAAVRARELNPEGTPEEQEAERQRALSDPVLAGIYQSPDVQAALQSISTDPRAAAEIMQDKSLARQILKLRAAGIIRFG